MVDFVAVASRCHCSVNGRAWGVAGQSSASGYLTGATARAGMYFATIISAMNSSQEAQDNTGRAGSIRLALFCGLMSAVSYTLANIALRSVIESDPIWVTAVKAVPTVICLAPFVLINHVHQRRPVAPQPEVIKPLVIGSIVGQILGNCAFQYSLAVVGMAVAIPICLGTLIIGSAICERIILKEQISRRTGVAMLILILATVSLSLGTSGSGEDVAGASPWILLSGLAAVAISGFAYAFFGVSVRRSLLSGMTITTTMFISGSIGTVMLMMAALARVGVQGVQETTGQEWLYMIAAGVFNLVAFFCLSVALKVVSVVVVNLLNTSQIAMGAVAGVFLFQERFTLQMAIGIGLTVLGLFVLGGRRRSAKGHEDSDSEESTSLPCEAAVLSEPVS